MPHTHSLTHSLTHTRPLPLQHTEGRKCWQLNRAHKSTPEYGVAFRRCCATFSGRHQRPEPKRYRRPLCACEPQSVRPLCSQVVESLLEELRPRAHELQEKLITAMAAAERKSDELEPIELRFALTNLVTCYLFPVLSLPLCVLRIGVALWLYVGGPVHNRLFDSSAQGIAVKPRDLEFFIRRLDTTQSGMLSLAALWREIQIDPPAASALRRASVSHSHSMKRLPTVRSMLPLKRLPSQARMLINES